MKFDICLMNPPFNIGEKMLTKWFDIANEICTVLPSTWLLGKQLKKDIVKNVDAWEKAEIESIQGSEHFDAGISGVMAILHFIRGKGDNKNNSHYDKQERIKFDGKWYKECREITKFSDDPLLEKLNNIIEKLYIQDNLNNNITYSPGLLSHAPGKKQHTEYNPDPNWWCIRMVKQSHDMCILPTSSNLPHLYKNIGFKKVETKKKNGDILKKPYMEYYYHFNNKQKAINCINYFKTFFVRIILKMYITLLLNFLDTTTLYIPWFDFDDPMFNGSPEDIDIALFKKYNISLEIVDHILELIPNYYNLDLSKYKKINE